MRSTVGGSEACPVRENRPIKITKTKDLPEPLLSLELAPLTYETQGRMHALHMIRRCGQATFFLFLFNYWACVSMLDTSFLYRMVSDVLIPQVP